MPPESCDPKAVTRKEFEDLALRVEKIHGQLLGEEKLTNERFAGIKLATSTAFDAYNVRLAGLNEFRQRTDDLTSTFVTRTEQALSLAPLNDFVSNYNADRKSYALKSEVQEMLKPIQASMDYSKGGRNESKSMVAIGIALLSIGAALIDLVLRATGH